MTQTRFDARIFGDAARAIAAMKAGDPEVDLSAVSTASKYLEGYGKTLDEFERVQASTRCLLWAGARRICRKQRTEAVLFAVIREMVGSTRDIKNANGKLDRTHLFLTELGSIGT